VQYASFAYDKIQIQTVKTLNLQVKTVTLHMKGEQRKHNWNATVRSCVISPGRHLCCVGELQVMAIWSNVTVLEYNFEFQTFVEGESNDFNCYYFYQVFPSYSAVTQALKK
jgi:hypothetical protein